MRKLLLTPMLLLGLLAACDQSPPTAIPADNDARFQSEIRPGSELFAAIMTRNLYLGTDVAQVLAAEPEQIPLAVWTAHVEIMQSQPAERMARIADEIATGRPDLIGLQEVAMLYTQLPGDFFLGNPQQADVLQFDYLQLLLDALSARGLNYQVASLAVNMDIEIPAYDPIAPALYDVRLINRDVILAREGVRHRNAHQGIFAAHVPVELGGMEFPFVRSWTSVDARVQGYEFRFVNTHLEAYSPLITWLQARELLGIVGPARLPVVMVGDFNSPADTPAEDPIGDAYRSVLAAGFIDVWAAANPGQEGLTCCDEDLASPTRNLYDRRDFIFLGGRYRVPRGFRGVGSVLLVGNDPANRTPSGLWPSDHNGVLAQVWLP